MVDLISNSLSLLFFVVIVVCGQRSCVYLFSCSDHVFLYQQKNLDPSADLLNPPNAKLPLEKQEVQLV